MRVVVCWSSAPDKNCEVSLAIESPQDETVRALGGIGGTAVVVEARWEVTRGRATHAADDTDRGQRDGSRHSDHETDLEGVSHDPSSGLAAVQTGTFSSRQAACATPA